MPSSGAEDHLAELPCLWAPCPDPCCWAAERRAAGSVYQRADGPHRKRRCNTEESSPSLSLVDVSEWSTLSSGGTSRSRTRPPRRDAAPRLKTTGPSFPAIISAAAKSRARERGTRDQADETAHISPPIGSLWGSGALVLWIPNPSYVPQSLKRCPSKHTARCSESLGCSVKELICLPAARTPNTSKSAPKKNTKRVRFRLSQWAESVSPGQLEAGTGDDPNTSAAVDDPKHPSVFTVKNTPAVFHSVREKRVARAHQDVPASLYKLDSRTAEEEVDWDGLRRQPYLWKRHNGPAEYLSPPGGAKAQETPGSSSVSKPSSDRTVRSPQCAGNNPSPAPSRVLRIITGAMELCERRHSAEHPCTSIPPHS